MQTSSASLINTCRLKENVILGTSKPQYWATYHFKNNKTGNCHIDAEIEATNAIVFDIAINDVFHSILHHLEHLLSFYSINNGLHIECGLWSPGHIGHSVFWLNASFISTSMSHMDNFNFCLFWCVHKHLIKSCKHNFTRNKLLCLKFAIAWLTLNNCRLFACFCPSSDNLIETFGNWFVQMKTTSLNHLYFTQRNKTKWLTITYIIIYTEQSQNVYRKP